MRATGTRVSVETLVARPGRTLPYGPFPAPGGPDGAAERRSDPHDPVREEEDDHGEPGQ